MTEPAPDADPRADQYAAERQALVDRVHKAMLSSYIGPPRPMLLGDADRAVAAVVTAGWRPGTVTEQQVVEAAKAIEAIESRPTHTTFDLARAALESAGLTMTRDGGQ